jgi:hypothetical protein
MASSAPPGTGLGVAGHPTVPAPAAVPRVSWAQGPASSGGLLGRRGDRGWLAAGREAAREGLVASRIVAPAGFGKTRLLQAFTAACRERGDAVALVGPDPWRAGVGYSMLRQAVHQLSGSPSRATDPSRWAGADADVRTALGVVFGTGSDRGADDLRAWSEAPPRSWKLGAQRALAAGALRWALGRAAERAPNGAVILAVDDLQAIDGASRNALADVLRARPSLPLLVVASHEPGFDPAWASSESRTLAGLDVEAAAAMLEGSRRGSWPPASSPRPLPTTSGARDRNCPMLLQQLALFANEGGVDPPPRLGDVVALRLERLPADRRRALQALAVLGDATPASQLSAALADGNGLHDLLGELHEGHWLVRPTDGTLCMHPLVREITLGSTPAEVRRRLHARARQSAALVKRGTPLEAHAAHAIMAQQPFEALMLLEQVASRAAVRGDFEGSIVALRAGLDLARHELAHDELDDPVSAALWFACRLGDALGLAGEPTQADGVLREALDLAGPAAALRPRLLASLANVAFDRGRHAVAHATLEEAKRLAAERGRRDWVSAFGRLRDEWACELGSPAGPAGC